MKTNTKHEKFMRKAIELAKVSVLEKGGGPFGAVVVKDGVIVGEGYNRVTQDHDPTAHAEVIAIRDACKNLQSFQLEQCIIYSSCEPCPMCLGAIYWARPKSLYFGASKEDAANADFDDSFIYEETGKRIENRSIETKQLLSNEAKKIFRIWIDLDKKQKY